MQKPHFGISIPLFPSLYLHSLKKANHIISHYLYQLLKKRLFFILSIVFVIMQSTICIGGNFEVSKENAKNKGTETITNVINAYDKRLENSFGKDDLRYIVKHPSLDLLKKEKIEELNKRIDEIKEQKGITPEAVEIKFSRIINEVTKSTSADARTIINAEDEKDWWAGIIIGASTGFFFIIICTILYFNKVSNLVIKSIRPIISLSLTILVFMLSWYALYRNLIEFTEFFPLLLALYGPIVGFYFGERSALKVHGKKDEEEIFTILPDKLPTGNVGEPYDAKLSASGGEPPYKFEITKGKLPKGLKIDLGKISGTPTDAETAKFTVDVTDKSNEVVSKPYTIIIEP